jgi:hypothetical protein
MKNPVRIHEVIHTAEEDLDVDGILKWLLKKHDWKMWTGFILQAPVLTVTICQVPYNAQIFG